MPVHALVPPTVHAHGAFWVMHEHLFEHQKALEDHDLKQYAFHMGLTAHRFERDPTSPEVASRFERDIASGERSGVGGTPTFYVNGVRHRGLIGVVRDRDVLRGLATIDGANAGHLANASVGIAIVMRPEVPDLDVYDEGRLAERILLATAAHGVGAAVGHSTGPGRTWAAAGQAKKRLGIPDERLLRETISLGYPAEHLQPTPNPPGRKPLAQLVHWEHYRW